MFSWVTSAQSSLKVAFDDASGYVFSQGLCVVKKGSFCGVVDTLGKQVVAFVYAHPRGTEFPRYREGFCVLCSVSEAGVESMHCLNGSGKEVFVDKSFQALSPFSEGVALAGISRSDRSVQWTFIRANGTLFANALASELSTSSKTNFNGFQEGLAPVSTSSGAYGYLRPDARWAIMPTRAYSEVGDFHNGRAMVRGALSQQWGVINTAGDLVIPYMYAVRPRDFSEGLALVRNAEGKVGYMDTLGNLKIPCLYEPIGSEGGMDFDGGYAVVSRGGAYYAVNTDGQEVKRLGDNALEIKPLGEGLLSCKRWTEEQGWSLSLMQTDGERIATENSFTRIEPFSEGLAYAVASRGGVFVSGFINKEGVFRMLRSAP
jgi:hypothetical protein